MQKAQQKIEYGWDNFLAEKKEGNIPEDEYPPVVDFDQRFSLDQASKRDMILQNSQILVDPQHRPHLLWIQVREEVRFKGNHDRPQL